MAQTAQRSMQQVDLQQIKYRSQNTQAAANDGTSVFLHAGQADSVRAAGADKLVLQPVQTSAADRVCWPSRGSQHITDRAHRARCAVGQVPGAAPVSIECFVEHRLGCNFCHFKTMLCELLVSKIVCRPADAT